MRFFLTIFFAFVALPILAANHYVYPGATGDSSGSDFSNAKTSFSAIGAKVRGDNYIIAGTNYAENVTIAGGSGGGGTNWVYVRGATSADSGIAGFQSSFTNRPTVLGWVSLEDGTIFWDGINVTNPATTTAGRTIELEADTSFYKIFNAQISGAGFTGSSNVWDGIYWNNSANQKGLWISNCIVQEVTRNGITLGSVAGTSFSDYGMLFENSTIYRTGGCLDADQHGQGMQICFASESRYFIIRNSDFYDISGSAMIAMLGGSGSLHRDFRIYNDKFHQSDTNTFSVSPGVIWAHETSKVTNILTANNTVFNASIGQFLIESTNAASNTLQNTVWENSNLTASNSGWTVYSHNGFFGNTGAGVTNPNGATNGQIVGESSTLVSSSNFHLSNGYAVGVGTNLSAFFTTDFDGVTRSAWDLGAYAYVQTQNTNRSILLLR